MFIFSKKYFLPFILAVSFFCFLPAQAEEVNKLPTVYLFYSKTCPHCEEEIEFLKSWKEENPEMKMMAYEVTERKENAELAIKVVERLGGRPSGVPITVIGDKYIVGFYSAETTGKKIKAMAVECQIRGEECKDVVAEIQGGEINTGVINNSSSKEEKMSLPVLGEINPGEYSLFSLSFIIGLLDGFNPCASWALLFIIMLLIGMKDRFRMWTLGISFLVASAATYFVFMAFWLNVMVLIGYSFIIRIIIGGTALVSGMMYLKKWKDDGKNEVCIITKEEGRRKFITESLKDMVGSKNFWVALFGVVVLGVLVNIFELFCSLGLPAVFTGYLASAGLPYFEYYFYLLVYIFAYMLDDIIIFAIAMKTMKVSNITTKYAGYLYLIGGIALLFIGGWMAYGLF